MNGIVPHEQGASQRTAGGLRLVLLAITLFGFAAASVAAFTLEPISQDFSPRGPGATQTFRVNNTEDHPIAVKISMVRRNMDIHGHETYSDASDVFVVFPSQIVLKSKTSQVLRVQWRGPSTVATEQNFRIIAEELPVDFGEAKQRGGNISILFRYLGAVYIVPQNVKPDVTVEKVETIDEQAGRHGFLLSLKNRGNAHVLLNDLTITVTGETSDGTPYKRAFGPDALPGVDGENMLSGIERVFYVPAGGPLPESNLHADFSYTPTR